MKTEHITPFITEDGQVEWRVTGRGPFSFTAILDEPEPEPLRYCDLKPGQRFQFSPLEQGCYYFSDRSWRLKLDSGEYATSKGELVPCANHYDNCTVELIDEDS